MFIGGHANNYVYHPNAYVVDIQFCNFDVTINGDDI